MQHDHVDEGVALLCATRPDIGDDVARVLVHGALSLIGDLSRTSHLRERPGFEAELTHLGQAVLSTTLT